MIFDKQSLFSDAQAITATAASTNVIDLGAPGSVINGNAVERDLGAGMPVKLQMQVVEDFDNLTSLTVALQNCDAEGFGSGVVTVLSTTIVLADLIEGKHIPPQYIPQGTNLRYLRAQYTVTGTAPTAGKVTAGIVCGHQTN